MFAYVYLTAQEARKVRHAIRSTPLLNNMREGIASDLVWSSVFEISN